jgi:hypothetical protein
VDKRQNNDYELAHKHMKDADLPARAAVAKSVSNQVLALFIHGGTYKASWFP